MSKHPIKDWTEPEARELERASREGEGNPDWTDPESLTRALEIIEQKNEVIRSLGRRLDQQQALNQAADANIRLLELGHDGLLSRLHDMEETYGEITAKIMALEKKLDLSLLHDDIGTKMAASFEREEERRERILAIPDKEPEQDFDPERWYWDTINKTVVYVYGWFTNHANRENIESPQRVAVCSMATKGNVPTENQAFIPAEQLMRIIDYVELQF